MTQQTRLLVRVDDAGSSWSSNIGCLQACLDGPARSAEVMIPGHWILHAAEIFNAQPSIDIGIHLTLTSEWDWPRMKPLTTAPSLTDQYGYFLPLLTPRETDPRPALSLTDWQLGEVFEEFDAQLQMGKRLFPQASHISSHMITNFRHFDERISKVIEALVRKYHLRGDDFGCDLTRIIGYPPNPKESGFRTSTLKEEILKLGGGNYILIDHPAAPSEELRAIGHFGYRDVFEDRVSCLETLTSACLTDFINNQPVELISYRDLEP